MKCENHFISGQDFIEGKSLNYLCYIVYLDKRNTLANWTSLRLNLDMGKNILFCL